MQCSVQRNDFHVIGPHLQQDPIRIVYVLGVIRSGSTLLDTILGNHPDMESTGELCHVSEDGWTADRRCACGRSAPRCPFWSEVRREWARLTGVDDEASYSELVRRMEKHRAWLPRLAREVRRRSARFREYADRTKALYQAIRTVSGKPVLVDSSKRGSRALLLSSIPGIDLRLVHLVRDGRGVAWSEKKTKENGVVRYDQGRHVSRTTALWVAGNLQSAWMRRRLPPSKSILVRYEDCVSRPRKVLSDIGRLIDLNMNVVADDVEAGRPLGIGHTVAGNAMRLKGRFRLRTDAEWTTKMSPNDRRVCWALGGWLLRKYGYTRRPKGSIASG